MSLAMFGKMHMLQGVHQQQCTVSYLLVSTKGCRPTGSTIAVVNNDLPETQKRKKKYQKRGVSLLGQKNIWTREEVL
jgi:hypothetical protein